MSENGGQNFRVLGLDIGFPFAPYGIQKAMMNKITLTLTNKEHSLIESPTGTGKTLVLLCASLAWQKKSKSLSQPFVSERLKRIRAQERREKLMSRPCSCGRRPSRTELDELKEAKGGCKKGADAKGNLKQDLNHSDDMDVLPACKRQKTVDIDEQSLESSPYFEKKQVKQEHESDCIIIEEDNVKDNNIPNDYQQKVIDDDDDVCVIIDENTSNGSFFKPQPPKINLDQIDGLTASKRVSDSDEFKPLCKSCQALEAEDKFSEVLGEGTIAKAKIPRIYYGTRTHKQITQVIRELNKTEYRKNLRMCILSSRERTCINESVQSRPDRNDRCQELIKNKQNAANTKSKSNAETCPFYSDSNQIAAYYESINIDYAEEAWDIEEAAKFGRGLKACPYFGLRSLQEQADITFCPYNYLLDPNIRKAMNINLSNSIIIIDEAHNIEDICRDSASFVVDTRQVDELLETIRIASTHFVQGSVVMDAYQFFKDKLMTLNYHLTRFEFEESEMFQSNDYLAKRVMSQHVMLNELQRLGLGADHLPKIKESLKVLRGDDDESTEKSSSKSGDGQQNNMLSFNQMQILDQLCLTLNFIYSNNNKNVPDFRAVITKSLERDIPSKNPNDRRQLTQGDRHVFRLSLFCMNPGIAFEKIHSFAWSVIVASGTLSPIESLKSELGCTFKNIFEGSHVIGNDRIFASILSRGPSGVDLNCAFKNSLSYPFQDEVGAVVHDICKVVPNGILCFFPSYDRLENLYSRWKLKKLLKGTTMGGKKIFIERRNLTNAKFEDELAQYHQAAQTTGALLLAVYRGKVSEGIDFADAAARAVITIGIPYPNIKEITVSLKREYNDVARRTRPHLMSGGDWYASQAFRALNQAVGRCIRHKDDWGAIMMIDSRLKFPSSVQNISRWLRQSLVTGDEYEYSYGCLKEFVRARSSDF